MLFLLLRHGIIESCLNEYINIIKGMKRKRGSGEPVILLLVCYSTWYFQLFKFQAIFGLTQAKCFLLEFEQKTSNALLFARLLQQSCYKKPFFTNFFLENVSLFCKPPPLTGSGNFLFFTQHFVQNTASVMMSINKLTLFNFHKLLHSHISQVYL